MWPFKDQFVVAEYIQPFLNELSIVSNFSVKSQWLYLLPLDVSPRRVPDSSPSRRHFALRESILPQLVTPLEKKLGMYSTFVKKGMQQAFPIWLNFSVAG